MLINNAFKLARHLLILLLWTKDSVTLEWRQHTGIYFSCVGRPRWIVLTKGIIKCMQIYRVGLNSSAWGFFHPNQSQTRNNHQILQILQRLVRVNHQTTANCNSNNRRKSSNKPQILTAHKLRVMSSRKLTVLSLYPVIYRSVLTGESQYYRQWSWNILAD